MKNLHVLMIAIAAGVVCGGVAGEVLGDPILGLIVALAAFNAILGYRVNSNKQARTAE